MEKGTKLSNETKEKISIAKKGEKNPRWNGGVSEYPNHSLMKKNRLIKLQQTNAICEICKGKANTIHHKDGSKDNHALDNLIVLCHSCHQIIDLDRDKKVGHTSKFIREYGYSLEELSKKFNCSTTTIFKWHQKGRLIKELNPFKNDEVNNKEMITKKEEEKNETN